MKSYKEFKKDLQRKKEKEETMRELKGAMKTLENKRENYKKEAQAAMKNGNTSRMNVMIALMKQAMFNLKLTQDMEANFILANDMLEMQSMNKRFVKSLDSVMKNVYKTCKAIHVQSSEKNFTKALYLQTQTSSELKEVLGANNIMFADSVNTLSDISDEEVKELLGEGIALEEEKEDAELDELEQAFKGLMNKQSPSKAAVMEGGSPKAKAPAPAPAPKAEAPKAPAPKAEEPKAPTPAPAPAPAPKAEAPQNAANGEDAKQKRPEDELLEGEGGEGGFIWDNIPTIGFDDIAGLEEVKEVVRVKVLLPLKNPEAFAGYEKKSGGGLCLYGPPGTGKTMIAAAIAKEIGAKFCSVKPSDLLQQGAGNTEKAVRTLFSQARKFPCAVIYFDEMDSISPKSTRSQYAKQLRSEFLAQLQGVESYGKDKGNILFLICATNKPWDIDSAFLRPGRFGTKVYVGLPDAPAREYMVNKRIEKIAKKGIVDIQDDLDIANVVEKTNGFNGSDITNLLDRIEELSIIRGIESGEKYIGNADFENALNDIHSSVQTEDLIKLKEWRNENDK
ncbi:MAG: ATP-binding protein [Clostridiales bacterium]|nr:ATP-binding protein [Clostridiales bacterium]